jgi:hypothetical protein
MFLEPFVLSVLKDMLKLPLAIQWLLAASLFYWLGQSLQILVLISI